MMFGAQAFRLMRKKWGDAVELSQELYAMLDDKIPLTTNAPITISLPPGDNRVPLQIKNNGDGFSINFTGKNGEPVGGIDNSGNLVNPDGSAKTAAAGKTTNVSAQKEAYAGQVIGGSGSSYTCYIYSDDGVTQIIDPATGLPQVATVKQLQIAGGATIPIGTWTPVFKSGGKYWMQVPVWV